MIKGSELEEARRQTSDAIRGSEGEDTRAAGRKGEGGEGLLLQVGIQLSRNVLTVMSYTVRVWRCPGGRGAGGGSAFWRALRRCHHLLERATDCKQMTKKNVHIKKG